jgi:hypothetical protein
VRKLDLCGEYYKNYGNEVTLLTGGLSNHRHCHLYSVLSAHGLKSDSIVHGYMGDVYAGGAQPAYADRYEMSAGEAMELFLRSQVRNRRIWAMVSQPERDNILSDLEEIMHECLQANLPCHFSEYIYNVDRQASLIANIFIISECFGHVVRPFANMEYAVFFNSLPFKYRKDRYLYRKAALKLFPEPFGIGNQSQIFPKRSLHGKMEQFLSRVISGLSFVSFLFTRGWLVLPNPKGYERHRQVLFGNLRSDFFDSIAEMGAILGADLGPFRDVSFKNRTELTSQFRILSSAVEIRHLRQKEKAASLGKSVAI